jgi:hypothetical protein
MQPGKPVFCDAASGAILGQNCVNCPRAFAKQTRGLSVITTGSRTRNIAAKKQYNLSRLSA